MRFLVAAFFAALLAASAHARPSAEALATETERDFSVPVPKSEISLDRIRFHPKRSSEYMVSVSSYAPEDFERGSYTGKVSTFDTITVPTISVNRLSEIYTGENLNISLKTGFSYLQMERSGTRKAIGSYEGSVTETMNFFMARAGLESAWPNVLPWGFEPNLSFNALPTWIFAAQSAYEENVGAFGLPLEASVGLLWRSNVNSTKMGHFSAGVAYQTVSGSIAGSSVRGRGVLGELRITL